MEDALKTESERLTRSWMQHDPAKLRDYLVAGVEDPRINLQSILSRHFLIRALFGEKFEELMQAEYRFSAVMNWLLRLARRNPEPDELDALLHALERGADNAEGLEIPGYVLHSFAGLPGSAGDLSVPNYVRDFLAQTSAAHLDASGRPALDSFAHLWRRVLVGQAAMDTAAGFAGETSSSAGFEHSRRPRLLEPACGSANDYRFLHSYGLGPFFEYTGLDLCLTNVENARALFPNTRFEVGNVFELAAPDKSFELSFTHDLFEHLSPAGLPVAVGELCRVTSRSICVGFFQMDEIAEHVVRPVDDYHWNMLSMARMKELFARHGFSARVWHIGTFLRQELGCEETHNPNAYTFMLGAVTPTRV